ncbi:unnamed protein product [Symbiodinium necroappetens]|uniref:Uncharacterized protein n=1 Tax=Symbiodinium necroappetens TaxID=1628268 RepID=A0A812VLT4_9DINO|nr:unnamed protein product [Symbiodinium necroappetens]
MTFSIAGLNQGAEEGSALSSAGLRAQPDDARLPLRLAAQTGDSQVCAICLGGVTEAFHKSCVLPWIRSGKFVMSLGPLHRVLGLRLSWLTVRQNPCHETRPAAARLGRREMIFPTQSAGKPRPLHMHENAWVSDWSCEPEASRATLQYTSAAASRSKGSLQKCTSMVMMLLKCALVALAAVEAVRYDTASRSAEPVAVNTVKECGDMSMHVSGTSDEGETIDETSWLDSDIVNSFGGYPIFQRQTSDGRRLQYYLGCNHMGHAVLYFDELDDDGEPVPGTFAVRQLEIGQPLRIYVGMDGEGEEAAEFSWSLLILETLVQGVVTFWDDSGVRFTDFIGPPPPRYTMTTTSTPRTIQPQSAWRRARRGLWFVTTSTPEPEPAEDADESQSEADSDIVSIQTGRVQRALQLDPGTQEEASVTTAVDPASPHLRGLTFCHRGVTLEIQGTMNRTASNKSVLKPVHQKVKVPASFYTKLGGMRIYTKQAHGQLDKVYFLRCDYTNGQPFLIMRQGGDVQVRRFNIKWWRTTSISESLGERLTLLADPTSVPYPVVKGYITVTPD